jgi:glycosyltransferase involved in cell wall biosynthesis
LSFGLSFLCAEFNRRYIYKQPWFFYISLSLSHSLSPLTTYLLCFLYKQTKKNLKQKGSGIYIYFFVSFFSFIQIRHFKKSQMRIAIITENFLPKVDGVTRTLARLLEHLSITDHQVILLGPETNLKTYAGAELVGTYGIPFFLYPELKFNFWRPRFTEKLLEFQPDVIHLVDPVFLGAFGLAVIRYYLPHVPIVSSYHTNLAVYCDHFGYGFLTSIMWNWNRYCHSFSQFIACPSPSTKSILTEHRFDRVRLWPRGVDISLFSPTQRSEALRARWMGLEPCEESMNKKVILYVGRVSFEKNIHLVIEAYKAMDHAACHLVIVGHGPAFHEIQSSCLELGIPVTFTGYLQGTDLSQAYASADLFAFPSVTETFGQVVLEAMASGLPVVGLEAEGVKDLVAQRRTGLLLNTFGLSVSDQQLKYRGLLETLVAQHGVLKDMSLEAVKEAKKYTWYEAMDCMVQVYQNAMDCVPESLKVIPDDQQNTASTSEYKNNEQDLQGDDSGVEEDYDYTPETKKAPILDTNNGNLLVIAN